MLELSRTIRVIRRRWATIVVIVSLTLIVGAVITNFTPKQYESRVQFWVSTSKDADADDLFAGSAYLTKQIVSYTELLKTPMMRESVAAASGTDITPGQLASATTVSNPPGSVLLLVNVELLSREDAFRVAKAYSEVFPSTVGEIDRVGDRPSPVKVTVVGEPVQASVPSSPNPANNLAFALVLGLALGIAGAEVRQMLDSKVRTKDDVEEITERPLLGSVPFDGDTQAHPLALDEARQSKRAEAYRSLRTNLQFVDVADHPRVIVVTSSLPHEGKSTTVANLALALARGGRRVCLVEADLRRPKLVEYLGLSGKVGLTDVLIGKRQLGEVVQPYGDGGLAVVGSGPLPPNPSELLGSAATVEVLRELADLFDYVLLDGAPLLPVTDSAVLAQHADGALLIARHGLVTRDQLTVAVDSLRHAQANLLGVILNRVPKSSLVANAYGSGYYYAASRSSDADQAIKGSTARPTLRQAPRPLSAPAGMSARQTNGSERLTPTTDAQPAAPPPRDEELSSAYAAPPPRDEELSSAYADPAPSSKNEPSVEAADLIPGRSEQRDSTEAGELSEISELEEISTARKRW